MCSLRTLPLKKKHLHLVSVLQIYIIHQRAIKDNLTTQIRLVSSTFVSFCASSLLKDLQREVPSPQNSVPKCLAHPAQPKSLDSLIVCSTDTSATCLRTLRHSPYAALDVILCGFLGLIPWKHNSKSQESAPFQLESCQCFQSHFKNNAEWCTKR